MQTNKPFRRNLLSNAALVIALSMPAVALADESIADRAAAASDPEYHAAYVGRSATTPRPVTPKAPESAAARAAAASDPENAGAYSNSGIAARDQGSETANASVRSAMVSDPENVASHTEG
jgi:hypothetical protein